MDCPDCQKTLDLSYMANWVGFTDIPVQCGCGYIGWSNFETIKRIDNVDEVLWSEGLDDIPSLPKGDLVCVVNEQHKKHLHPGFIIDKAHIHYRIEFLDNIRIWMPEHWIKKAPEYML